MIDKNCYEWTHKILTEVFNNASLVVTDKIVRVIFNCRDSGDTLKCIWTGNTNGYCVDIFYNDKAMISSFNWEDTKRYIDMFHKRNFEYLQKVCDNNDFEL